MNRVGTRLASRRTLVASSTRILSATHKPPFPVAHFSRSAYMSANTSTNHGDLNNTEVLRKTTEFRPDAAYSGRTLAIPEHDDDVTVRTKYRTFLLDDHVSGTDWVSRLELSTVMNMVEKDMQQNGGDRLKVLMLYGSLRQRSYSRLLTLECARILFRLGCDVRVFDPSGLPVKDDVQHDHPKVQELRNLSKWSDGHVWISPEQHGNLVRLCPSMTIGLVLTLALDSCFQEPNRLDSTQHRFSPPDPRSHARHRASLWRLAVIQHRQFAPHPRSLDAHVYYSESVVHPQSLHAIHRCSRSRRQRRLCRSRGRQPSHAVGKP